MKVLGAIVAVLLFSAAAIAQQTPKATQILGSQVGLLATNNAEMVEEMSKLRQQAAALSKENQELKDKCAERCKGK